MYLNGFCKIVFKLLRGICGVDVDIIVLRNFLRVIVVGFVCYFNVVENIVRN